MRVAFLVDGFNLYHSLCSATDQGAFTPLKWLDLHSMCRALLPSIGVDASLASIDYFTALPGHLAISNPARLERHRVYMRALTAMRNPIIRMHFGRIRRQTIRMQAHDSEIKAFVWREKGTDVALAARLMALGHKAACDLAVIVSGDTDYAILPVIFRETFGLDLIFALPFGRASSELADLAPGSLLLSPELYQSCQLPEMVRLPSGRYLHKPREWGAHP
jgi:uncharacterized LabA/DUF88 family protein